jgi:anthranilate phosphoribosyltransferase
MFTSNLAERIDFEQPAAPDADTVLGKLYVGQDLTEDEAEALFAELVAGRLAEPQMAAMLVALRLKGEVAAELIGAARALRAADEPFPRPDYLFADTCGTGGDGSGTINVSTAVAFVAAACGLPIAKHGNRSVTSRCGSADVLEHLGAKLDVSAAVSRRALNEVGVCFLFAPAYHPGLRHAGPVRRALKVRTIMNLLGPCVNPAEPSVQLLGVPDPALLEPVARTLQALGVRSALVVHGAGLDEVALHAATQAVQLQDGQLRALTLTPEQAGLSRAPLQVLKGGGPAENAERLNALLLGYGVRAEADMVALNAGALLMTAGRAADLAEGTALAAQALASGDAHRKLTAFVDATRG